MSLACKVWRLAQPNMHWAGTMVPTRYAQPRMRGNRIQPSRTLYEQTNHSEEVCNDHCKE